VKSHTHGRALPPTPQTTQRQQWKLWTQLYVNHLKETRISGRPPLIKKQTKESKPIKQQQKKPNVLHKSDHFLPNNVNLKGHTKEAIALYHHKMKPKVQFQINV
jgi:hypothetical protein